MKTHRRPRRASIRTQGTVLLEVVLALVLFFCGAAVVSASLQSAIRASAKVPLEAQAQDLAVTLMSELEIGSVELANEGPRAYEAPLEDWTWQVELSEPQELIEAAGLKRVTVRIRHEPTNTSTSLVRLVAIEARESTSKPTQGAQP